MKLVKLVERECECKMDKEERKKKSEIWRKPRKCLLCGKEFIPYNSASLFCSNKCRSKRYQLLEPLERRAYTLSSCIIGLKNKRTVIGNLLKDAIGKKCRYCNKIIK